MTPHVPGRSLLLDFVANATMQGEDADASVSALVPLFAEGLAPERVRPLLDELVSQVQYRRRGRVRGPVGP